MPVKLPAPDVGTEAQPGPKSVAVVAPEADEDAMGDEEEAAGDEPEAAVEELPELQAAAPRVQARARPDRAMNLVFTVFSLWDLS
jgi:hypothetical protein